MNLVPSITLSLVTIFYILDNFLELRSFFFFLLWVQVIPVFYESYPTCTAFSPAFFKRPVSVTDLECVCFKQKVNACAHVVNK